MLSEIHGHTLIGRELRSKVILDLGANQGAFAHEMIRRYGCRVLAVEANPAMVARIPPHPNLTVHHGAIAGHTGTLTLHLSSNPEASTMLSDQGGGSVTVPCWTLPDFLRSYGMPASNIALVKMDIEGAEIAALDACPDPFLSAFPQLTIEFHDFLGWTPRAVVERTVGRLEQLGFFPLKMWRSAWGDTLLVNRRRTRVAVAELQYAKHVTRPLRILKHAAMRLRAPRGQAIGGSGATV